MTRDQRTALGGIAEYDEDRVPPAALEATARLREADLEDDRELGSILHDFAMSVMATTLEALEANGIEMIGR